jgi:hypothetical protein
MIGAQVTIVQSKHSAKLVGIKGTIYNYSSNCFYMVESKNNAVSEDSEPANEVKSSPRIHRLIKADTVIAVLLPSLSSIKDGLHDSVRSENICVIHGSQFLEQRGEIGVDSKSKS